MAGLMATKVALHAVKLGADRIPDRVFESVPGGYFKPSEEEQARLDRKNRKKKEGKSRNSGRDRRSAASDHYSDYDTDPYYTSGDDYNLNRDPDRRDRRRRARSLDRKERSERRSRRDRHQSPENGYPPGVNAQSKQDDSYIPRPYNPADYAPPQAPAFAAASGTGIAEPQPTYGQPLNNSGFRQNVNPYEPYSTGHRPSTAEQRYTPINPQNYQSQPASYGANGQHSYTPPQSTTMPPSQPYSNALVAHHPNTYYPPVQAVPPPLFRRPSRSQPGSRNGSRHRHKSSSKRNSSLPRSFSRVRDKLYDMDDDQRKLAASAVGALAGGLLGHEIANDVGTAVGAVIGTVAMRRLEKKSADKHTDDHGSRDGERYSDGHHRRSSRRKHHSGSDEYDSF